MSAKRRTAINFYNHTRANSFSKDLRSYLSLLRHDFYYTYSIIIFHLTIGKFFSIFIAVELFVRRLQAGSSRLTAGAVVLRHIIFRGDEENDGFNRP